MKVYKSIYRTYSIPANINGRFVRLEFSDKGAPFNCSYFNTENKEEQDAIENWPDFGTLVILEEETKEEPKEEATFDKVYDEVRRTQDANKILISEYGVEKDSLSSKADALAAAKKLNISFPNL